MPNMKKVKSSRLIKRNCALRFPATEDREHVLDRVATWNERFRYTFEGRGFFDDTRPEIEEVTDKVTGKRTKQVACFLYADERFWADVSGSRTLTLDEAPAIAA